MRNHICETLTECSVSQIRSHICSLERSPLTLSISPEAVARGLFLPPRPEGEGWGEGSMLIGGGQSVTVFMPQSI